MWTKLCICLFPSSLLRSARNNLLVEPLRMTMFSFSHKTKQSYCNMSENPKKNQGNGSDIATGRCPWLGQRRSVYTRRPLCHPPALLGPCLRLSRLLPPHPASNRSLMLPWRHMRRRQNASFSLIHLPPKYSPATRPPPSYLSFKTSSSNLTSAAGATTD